MVDPKVIFGRLGNSLFQYAYIYSQMREGNIPDLYIQDFTYFEKYEREIKELFGAGINPIDYVSIHVRRASNPINPNEPKYAENSFYVNLSETNYYEQAIDMFPVDKFLVFSDDPEYCINKWGGDKRFTIMPKGNEVDDLNLMASCKHNIIANSSYSWWGAFLNPNPNKKVIAPKQWFEDKIQRVKFPKQWTVI